MKKTTPKLWSRLYENKKSKTNYCTFLYGNYSSLNSMTRTQLKGHCLSTRKMLKTADEAICLPERDLLHGESTKSPWQWLLFSVSCGSDKPSSGPLQCHTWLPVTHDCQTAKSPTVTPSVWLDEEVVSRSKKSWWK